MIGVLVLTKTSNPLLATFENKLIFSFDMLVHIIQLEKDNYTVSLTGFSRYYFVFHKLAGYALATYVIAKYTGWFNK